MAKFRQVYTEFWNDGRVIEEMTPEDKLFMVYLLTNPLTTQIGVYQITKKQMAFHLGYSIETINSLMDRFENHHKLIRYNSQTREIAVRNWGKYNFIRGGKPVYDLINSELKEVKDVNLIKWVYQNYLKQKQLNKGICQIFHSFLDNNDTITSRGTKRGQEEEEEKEEEVEEEIEEEEDEEEINKRSSSTAAEFNQVIEIFNNNIHLVTPLEYQKLEDWANEMTCEVVIRAIEEAVYYNKRSIGYINAILNNWLSSNLKDVRAVEAYLRDRADRKNQSSKNNKAGTGFREFDQRNYDFEELEKKLLGVNGT